MAKLSYDPYRHVGGSTLYLHVNNPGHWLENWEVWTTAWFSEKAAQQNGYVQEPWWRVVSYAEPSEFYNGKYDDLAGVRPA